MCSAKDGTGVEQAFDVVAQTATKHHIADNAHVARYLVSFPLSFESSLLLTRFAVVLSLLLCASSAAVDERIVLDRKGNFAKPGEEGGCSC
jgi:hypothetical protein